MFVVETFNDCSRSRDRTRGSHTSWISLDLEVGLYTCLPEQQRVQQLVGSNSLYVTLKAAESTVNERSRRRPGVVLSLLSLSRLLCVVQCHINVYGRPTIIIVTWAASTWWAFWPHWQPAVCFYDFLFLFFISYISTFVLCRVHGE